MGSFSNELPCILDWISELRLGNFTHLHFPLCMSLEVHHHCFYFVGKTKSYSAQIIRLSLIRETSLFCWNVFLVSFVNIGTEVM